MHDDATESAVVVRVPDADPLVAGHRARLDPSAAWGVPAHVTVLYPFVPPADLDDGVLARVAAVAAGVAPFTCRFATTGWFGDEVVWLAPDPSDPFDRLTQHLVDAAPGYPPYGGAFDDVVHHLTLGQGADPADLRRAAEVVARDLPLEVEVTDLSVMVGRAAAARWHVVADLPLGVT